MAHDLANRILKQDVKVLEEMQLELTRYKAALEKIDIERFKKPVLIGDAHVSFEQRKELINAILKGEK